MGLVYFKLLSNSQTTRLAKGILNPHDVFYKETLQIFDNFLKTFVIVYDKYQFPFLDCKLFIHSKMVRLGIGII